MSTGLQIFLAVVASGVLATITNNLMNRRRYNAQIESLKIKSISDLVDVLQEEVKRCHGQIDELRVRMNQYRQRENKMAETIEELRRENKQLRAEINKLKAPAPKHRHRDEPKS